MSHEEITSMHIEVPVVAFTFKFIFHQKESFGGWL
jgi:hypothetical protein